MNTKWLGVSTNAVSKCTKADDAVSPVKKLIKIT